MNQQAKPKQNISLKQCARLLNYSEIHVRRLIAQGAIPKKQRGPQCRLSFDRDVIIDLKRQWGR